MNFSKTEVWGFEHALRGMRNPLESWDKSDSDYIIEDECRTFFIGENDLILAQKLIKAGSEHRKFLRQILCSVDITAPLYWWKEFDTYKVGTVASSTSTMHKLASTPITIDCFEMDDFEELYPFEVFGRNDDSTRTTFELLLTFLEELRLAYNKTKDKRYWKELIRLLPESWLQTRTVTMNYENLFNMYHQRCVKPHKLTEWSVKFKEFVESLPYAKELIIGE